MYWGHVHLKSHYGIVCSGGWLLRLHALVRVKNRMITCSMLDFKTLGSQPIIPKHLPKQTGEKFLESSKDQSDPRCTMVKGAVKCYHT